MRQFWILEECGGKKHPVTGKRGYGCIFNTLKSAQWADAADVDFEGGHLGLHLPKKVAVSSTCRFGCGEKEIHEFQDDYTDRDIMDPQSRYTMEMDADVRVSGVDEFGDDVMPESCAECDTVCEELFKNCPRRQMNSGVTRVHMKFKRIHPDGFEWNPKKGKYFCRKFAPEVWITCRLAYAAQGKMPKPRPNSMVKMAEIVDALMDMSKENLFKARNLTRNLRWNMLNAFDKDHLRMIMNLQPHLTAKVARDMKIILGEIVPDPEEDSDD